MRKKTAALSNDVEQVAPISRPVRADAQRSTDALLEAARDSRQGGCRHCHPVSLFSATRRPDRGRFSP
jgi:hypothetical protein